MEIFVKMPEVEISTNRRFKGLGMVSGNNTSRLLIDYKREQPERYRELLRLMFDPEYLGITHLKIEMGADINSSSGTEPAVMRRADEKADVQRGAGYMLCKDAKAINPDIALDMLFWSEPAWVRDSNDVYDARYRWYKETLTVAYNTYGIKFDYLSLNRNERGIEPDWIKYCARRLKQETDCPYSFAEIKLIAADEEGSWHICELMAEDNELFDTVDVIGSHYTSHCTDTARRLWERGKELWFTEGCPPMSYSKGTARFDGSGLTGINGVLDIANRISAMYPCGCMTMYEFQPVVSAYYDGVTYGYKGLITAKEPWSGFYELESGFYMALHFSRFIKKGWVFVDNACACDGEKGGDGHAIVNAVHSFMTAADPENRDFSTVIVNSTDNDLEYTIVSESAKEVYLWETRGGDSNGGESRADFGKAVLTEGTARQAASENKRVFGGMYDGNYFRCLGSIKGAESSRGYEFKIAVKALSMVTVTTLNTCIPVFDAFKEPKSEILKLPYCDDYGYSDDDIKKYGGAPRYTTDQGGAFEITRLNDRNVLMQMITPDIKAEEWGATPLPVTCFGDDRWFNYSVSARVTLSRSNTPKENFAGIGLRYSQACKGVSGYSLLIYEDGSIESRRNGFVRGYGAIEGFDADKAHLLTVRAEFDKIRFFVDGELLSGITEEFPLAAGRAALFSSYNKNFFEDFKAEAPENIPAYIERFDDTDEAFEYTGDWEHRLMSGFDHHRRTLSLGKAGAVLTFSFNGVGFGLFGENKAYGYYKLFVDGKHIRPEIPDMSGSSFANMKKSPEFERENKLILENMVIPPADSRQLLFFINGLENGEHKAVIEIFKGELCVDGAEVLLGEQ